MKTPVRFPFARYVLIKPLKSIAAVLFFMMQLIPAVELSAATVEYDLTIARQEMKKQKTNGGQSCYAKPIHYGYYGWPMYSNGPHIWGFSPYIVRDLEKRRESTLGEKTWDPHLRSTHEVSGYHIQALDGDIGHVEDFIIDDETWTIRYLVVDTRNWWSGKKVLVSPQWIERVSWGESKIHVNLPLYAIKEAPEYTEKFLLTRDYETILHIHYNRTVYWTDISDENKPTK